MKLTENADSHVVSRWLVAALVVLLGMTGCVIPTPGLDSGEARRNIRKESAGQFQPGKTTRADVMLTLGEPDAVSPDEHMLAYRSEKVAAIFLVGAGYSGGGGSIEKDEYLVFEFDERKRLRKTERSTHWFGSADPAQKLGLSAAATRRDSNIRIETRASWLSGVDDYRKKGFVGAEWVPGTLVLTDTRLREDRLFIGRLLAVHTRAGQHYAFQIWGESSWTIDRAAVSKIQQFLSAKIPRDR
ncbi:MAG: hypothetical protein NTV46_13550 [Verrucomicrobia bacterium]|nr:hypothetical protein [Verrucomicrobiota bacterium]